MPDPQAAAEREFPNATPRPWYFDGWDIFTEASSAGPNGDGHRMVVPLKAINDAVFHESQRVSEDDARLIVAAVNERDALVVEVERLQAELARREADLAGLREQAGAVEAFIARYDHSADDCQGLCVVDRATVVADLRAALSVAARSAPVRRRCRTAGPDAAATP